MLYTYLYIYICIYSVIWIHYVFYYKHLYCVYFFTFFEYSIYHMYTCTCVCAFCLFCYLTEFCMFLWNSFGKQTLRKTRTRQVITAEAWSEATKLCLGKMPPTRSHMIPPLSSLPKPPFNLNRRNRSLKGFRKGFHSGKCGMERVTVMICDECLRVL